MRKLINITLISGTKRDRQNAINRDADELRNSLAAVSFLYRTGTYLMRLLAAGASELGTITRYETRESMSMLHGLVRQSHCSLQSGGGLPSGWCPARQASPAFRSRS